MYSYQNRDILPRCHPAMKIIFDQAAKTAAMRWTAGLQQAQHSLRRFPPPPAWPQAATQHVAQLKVKLPAFWTKDTGSWFMLTESTFNRSRVVVSGLRFDLVLPALSEEAIKQVHGG